MLAIVNIFLASMSIRCLNAVIVDSYYMPSQPKEQINTFTSKDLDKNSHSTREKPNEIMHDHYVKPLYKYGYSVFDPYTLDMKSQWEHRDGDFVRGAYNVLDADGSMRIVEYISDKDIGFRATVKKIPFYLDELRRPVEDGAKYAKPKNHHQESYTQNNQPLHKFNSQVGNSHYSQKYVQKEKYQKHYYNNVENLPPVHVYQRLPPSLQ